MTQIPHQFAAAAGSPLEFGYLLGITRYTRIITTFEIERDVYSVKKFDAS